MTRALSNVALAAGALCLAAALTSACRTGPGGAPGDQENQNARNAPGLAGDPHLRFVAAPAGDVPAVVQTAVAKAHADGRRLVVYEGATWCEPCKHFHEAVASGQLDATFPDLTLLEFDADRDRDRLIAAGYGSQYIPLFALPGKDGRAAGPKAAGGIKGDGVVQYLTQKLQALLSQGS